MKSRVAVGKKSKSSAQPGGLGKRQGDQPDGAQLELNDYGRANMPANDAKEGASYQRLGGRRDALPLGDYDESNREMKKDNLKRYQDRLEQQNEIAEQQLAQQQPGQMLGSMGPQGMPGMGMMPGVPGMPGTPQQPKNQSVVPRAGAGVMPAIPPGTQPAPDGQGLAGGTAGGGLFRGSQGPAIGTQAAQLPMGEGMLVGGSALPGQVAAIPQATGLTSLDIEIPRDTDKYNEFLFTTPQDDLTITARPISRALSTRLTGVAWLAGIIALAWVLTRRGVSSTLRLLAPSPFAGLLMIVLGVVSLVLSLLPMAGLLLGFLGICQLASWIIARGSKPPRRAHA